MRVLLHQKNVLRHNGVWEHNQNTIKAILTIVRMNIVIVRATYSQ
jgi:hypothetical protein